MSAQRDPWTGKDTAQCVWMVLGAGGGLLAFTGHLSIDDIRAYTHIAGEWAVPVVAGIGATVLLVGVLLASLKYLRVMLLSALRTIWLYRRRWAAVLKDLGLCQETAGGGIRVPKLVSVVRYGTEDVVSVRILPGQSAATYHECSAALADEFGASSARVQYGPSPHKDVVIVFDRRPAPRRRELLALPAPQPHPYPLSLPVPVPQQRGQQQGRPATAIRISGLRLQIVWARIPRIGHDGSIRTSLRQRYGVRGEVRWATQWAAI